MRVRRETSAIATEVYKTEGYGKRAHKSELFRIRVKPQTLGFALEQRKGIPYMVEFTIQGSPPRPESPSAEGSWSTVDFYDFEVGIERLAQSATEIISDDATLVLDDMVGEGVHAAFWFEDVTVSEGLFSKSGTQRAQFLQLNILGIDTGKLQWVSGMFSPVTILIQQFEQQRNAFEADVLKLLGPTKDTGAEATESLD